MTWRTYSGGGGGGRRYSGGRGRLGGGDRSFTLSFPGFRGAVRTLVLANVAVYFGLLLLGFGASRLVEFINFYGQLLPRYVVTHGAIWQLVTYGFLHSGIWHIAGNMFQLWMFGTALEDLWGRHKFFEFYFFTLIGAAILTVAIAYTGILGMTPGAPVIGASGAIMGILVAFGILYAEQEIFLFPFPIGIKAKYFIIILLLINLAAALGPNQFVAYATHLAGALCGFLYVKFMPQQGMRFLASERYYGVRNSYYRWKRRRAAKKFEVYMRKHDKNEFFDQYGNYKAPDDKDKGNGESGRGGWVN